MTALRIAYVLGTAAAGTGYHAAMLAEGCAARGMNVMVIGPAATRPSFFDAGDASRPGDVGRPGHTGRPGDAGESGDAGQGDDAGIRFDLLDISDRPRPRRDAAAVRRLRGLLAGLAPDVVHAHGTRAGAFAAAALWRPSRRQPSAPRQRPALVVTMHNAPPAGALASLIYRGLERVIAHRADAVLCASGDLADRMRRLGAHEVGRAVVPAPASDPPSAEAVRQAQADIEAGSRPVVLAVGRLAGQKGFGVLLDAAAAWQDAQPRPRVAIAGEGPLAGELSAAAGRAGIDVVFLGARRDVPALLAAADVVVVPSMWEARALIVQEALTAGRPLVASRVGGIPELTGDDGAVLVPPSDAGQLAAAVLAILGDPALAARLSAAALARAAALPSESAAVDTAASAYAALAAGKPLFG
ncbi:MAG: glycosyltransferase family 4 protein [Actinomycetota bacterium]